MGLGKRLEQVISSRNLKIMQVASMSGVPASTLYSIIERDNKKIDIDILIRICKALEIPVEYLLDQESNSDLKVTIGERIKYLRESKGLTQIEFAQKLNVSYGTIAMWETGKRTPGIETIKKIADFFGVPPGSITGWENNSTIELTVSAANIDRIKAQILSIEQKLSELKEAVEELEKMGLGGEIR